MRPSPLWDKVAGWTLPALLLGIGIFPPHVVPSLAPVFALGVLLLILASIGRGTLNTPPPALAATLCAAGFILFLSSFTAFHQLRSIRIAILWFMGGVVFLAARHAESGTSRRIISALIILGTALGILGLYQSSILFQSMDLQALDVPLMGGGERAAEAARVRIQSGRAIGTLGLPALLASLLILGIPLAAGRGLAASGRGRVIWLLASAVQAAALAATLSVGGLAALTIAAGLCATYWTGSRPLRRIAAITGVMLVVLVILSPRLEHVGRGSAVQSLAQRVANWKSAVSMIVTHPVLGVGPDNFGIALPAHRSPDSNETQHAHNSYLELIADTGLGTSILLLLAAAWMFLAIRDASMLRKAEPGAAKWTRRALAVASLAWLLQNFVDFGAYVGASLLPFMAVAGLLARESALVRLPGAAPPQCRSAGLGTRAIILAAAILAVAFTIPDARSRTHLEEAARLAGQGAIPQAVEEARRAAFWNPMDPESRAFLAQALLRQATNETLSVEKRRASIEESLLLAEQSVAMDPMTANRRAILAGSRAASGDVAGAYAAMAMAARLNSFNHVYQDERDALQRILVGAGPPEPVAAGEVAP